MQRDHANFPRKINDTDLCGTTRVGRFVGHSLSIFVMGARALVSRHYQSFPTLPIGLNPKDVLRSIGFLPNERTYDEPLSIGTDVK
jgi:hypothetical protein